MSWVTECVTCLHGLHTQEGNDVACLSRINFSALVSVHFDDAANALCLTSEGVENAGALGKLTRVNTGESQCAIFVVHDLERKCTEWFVDINSRKFTGFFTFSIHFRLRLDLGWRG